VAEDLALEVGGDGEDLQTVLARQIDSLAGVRGGALVGVAAAQVQLPARLLPAVEADVGDEAYPFRLGDCTELAAAEADLVVRSLAEAMFRGLLEAHESAALSRRVWRDGSRRECRRLYPPGGGRQAAVKRPPVHQAGTVGKIDTTGPGERRR